MHAHKHFVLPPQVAEHAVPRLFRFFDLQPLTMEQIIPLAAFENHKQFASASSLNDLAQSARTWLKRTTGRDFIVTLEPADQE